MLTKTIACVIVSSGVLFAQGFGGPGRGPGQMPGGPGGQPDLKLLKQFDQNNDGWLNLLERKEARNFVKSNGPRGMGRMGGRGGNMEPAVPGPALVPSSVTSYPPATTAIHDLSAMRTFFLQFENADWEKELEDFHGTDVDVPATLIVDGATYRDVGVRFRGASSYMNVPEGRKRSLNLSIDMAHPDQHVLGARTLN
jgi:hypothetical protein